MELFIGTNSFRSYGGSPEFSSIEALFALTNERFGEALKTVELDLLFACKKPFAEQRAHSSLSKSYDDFHARLDTCRKTTFRRKKAQLDLTVMADFAFAEDVIPVTKEEFQERNKRYRHDWNLAIVNLLISEFEACEKKFKPSDDFDYSRFMNWLRALPGQVPETKLQADALADQLKTHREQARAKMSDWEKLDLDWDEFHPDARDLVPDHRLWSSTDDFAPNGNDTGADVLAHVQEHKTLLKKSKDGGWAFYQATWTGWGFEWPPIDASGDTIDYEVHRQLILGLAFAYLKVFGQCPQWLRLEAQKQIDQHEEFLNASYPDWAHKNECLSLQTAMSGVLNALKDQ